MVLPAHQSVTAAANRQKKKMKKKTVWNSKITIVLSESQNSLVYVQYGRETRAANITYYTTRTAI